MNSTMNSTSNCDACENCLPMTEKIKARIKDLNSLLEKNKESLSSNNATLAEVTQAVREEEIRGVAISNRIAELNELLAQEAK